MTGEEMERAIEFLLRSQANLEAQDQINASLRAADARTDERLNKLIALFEHHITVGH